ncbi:30S ribosomal protein S16 [Candidatus Saccharibacteria bacterium]|nr:MAG: 30S ribosomal protein S16 [Candidatus Saccharibacteria bacterium]
MLAIRMQRTGRKGHAMFRVVVQDARRTPTSGRVVATVGHYDPHTKATQLVTDKITYYLQNGAQPSDRVVRLLQAEGVDLPKWVSATAPKQRSVRNPEKLRRNQPKEEAPAEPAEDAAAEAPAEEAAESAEA